MSRVALLGFGEAGAAIGGGLAEAGADVVGYDAADPESGQGRLVQQRATAGGVELATSVEAALAGAQLAISVVVPSAARRVTEAAALALRPGQLLLDLNSVAPSLKRALAAIVEPTGAAFVEGAILAAVPPRRHQVPIVLAGPEAHRVVAILGPLGATIEVLGPEIGACAALKMQRSLVVKGIEALFVECIAGSEQYGITGRLLDSLEETFPGAGWREMATYLTSRTALHAARRSHELAEVATALSEIGVEPIMAAAIQRRLAWAAGVPVGDLIDGDRVDTDRLWRRFAGLDATS